MEDEDDYDDRRGGYGSGAMVPARRRPSPRPSVLSGIVSALAAKAASAQEDTKGKVLEWRKIAKGKFSSTFERFMLQLTWPDDNPVDATFLQDLIHYMDTQDDYPTEYDKNNPFRRTLRKLWARMCEKDWRTVAKSLVLVHAMSRDLTPTAATRVRKHINTMRRELDPKNPSERYFQLARVTDVSPVGEPFRPLLKDYGKFAFNRVVAFDGGVRKLSAMLRSPKTSEAAAVTALAQIDALICQGLRCKIERKSQQNAITKSIIQYTSADLLDLWRLLSSGVERLCRGHYSSAQPARQQDAEALLNKIPDTQAALDKYLEQFRKFVKDRSALDDSPLDKGAIAAYLAALEGGSAAVADDEDEEEEEEEEEEEAEEEAVAGAAAGGDAEECLPQDSPDGDAEEEEEVEDEDEGDEDDEEEEVEVVSRGPSRTAAAKAPMSARGGGDPYDDDEEGDEDEDNDDYDGKEAGAADDDEADFYDDEEYDEDY